MEDEDISVSTFRKYLRFDTSQPNPRYDDTVEFLKQLASEIELNFKTVLVAPSNPVVILTWPGKDATLPSIFLNSHMDVVPVFREHWKYDPFSAHKDEKGNIYARGSQDMKCVGIQYVEAIRRLKAAGRAFSRTIHVVFVPDEEVGGGLGMALFVETKAFQELNVGFALDEGIAEPGPVYQIFYAERAKWWLTVTCSGNTGHGSRFIENTAAEKFQKVVNKFLAFREEQREKLKNDPSLNIGDVITVNLTMISGGVQVNVVPAEFIAHFDIRVPPTLDMKAIRSMFAKFCTDTGPDISFIWQQLYDFTDVTKPDENNIWWKALLNTFKERNLPYETKIFSGGTDARFLRWKGIPAVGFSPMINTPTMLHEHNEFLNERVFLKGLELYTWLIPALADAK